MSTPYHRYLFVFVVCASVYFLILYTPDKGGNLFTVEDLGGTEMAQEGRLGQQNYTRTIVGIGDLHGDLPNALKVLKMTNVIDDDNNWSGKVDFLVQTGDIIALYKLMEKLREQAPRKGGLFLSTLGNHEVMNAIGKYTVLKKAISDFSRRLEVRQLNSSEFDSSIYYVDTSITRK
ncbi:hypothetical protein FRC18_009442 [Serendipita sp. 400]|nr:hypothetical protein FRC18_009442 [Serendipita sp. 400]